MAGAACKTIINKGYRAMMEAAETILLNPNVHENRLPEAARLGLIQKLADIDIAAYTGGIVPAGGLRGVIFELQRYGLVTPEVWDVFSNQPEVKTLSRNKKEK